MPVKNLAAADKPIYSKKTIEKLHQVLKDKIAAAKRLRSEGKLSFRKRFSRFIIKTGDLIIIFGKTERTAQRHMARVREKLGKKKEMVSVIEFCKVTGLDIWLVQTALDIYT